MRSFACRNVANLVSKPDIYSQEMINTSSILDLKMFKTYTQIYFKVYNKEF